MEPFKVFSVIVFDLDLAEQIVVEVVLDLTLPSLTLLVLTLPWHYLGPAVVISHYIMLPDKLVMAAIIVLIFSDWLQYPCPLFSIFYFDASPN